MFALSLSLVLEASMTVPVDVRFPICDVCNRQVQTIEWWDDYAQNVRHFKVACHGETETAVLPGYMIEDSLSITMGRAFVKERLDVQNARKISDTP
jgi:hypothetical protein